MNNRACRKYLCRVCGFVYDEAKGDVDGGLAPGTRYEDIPDDWICPLCGVSKAEMVLMADRPPSRPPARQRAPRADADPVVIVGGGIGGWSAAQRVRARVPDRNIVLISACDGHAYPKPALSVAVAKGQEADDLIDQRAEEKAAALDLTLRARTRVLRIDVARRRLVTTRGTLQYGDLVLALGAAQIRLPLSGGAVDDVLYVNDLGSYRELRTRLSSGVQRVLIVGAGLIGCEFAEDLAAGGYPVTLIDQATLPLAQLAPQAIATALRQALLAKGIVFRGGSRVDTIERGAGEYRVTLDDGSTLRADVVVSAIGLAPLIKTAVKAGIGTARGVIATASSMRTSAEHVYALGDCAQVNGALYSYIEPIQRQAATLAAALADQVEPFETRAPLVRVKTPSLPIAVCRPAAAGDDRRWHIVDQDGGDLHLECGDGAGLIGFAVSGACARLASELYARVEAHRLRVNGRSGLTPVLAYPGGSEIDVVSTQG